MSRRVEKQISRLLGLASVEAASARPSVARKDFNHEEQRLLDGFRLLHAHRDEFGDPGLEKSALARRAGLTELELSAWQDELKESGATRLDASYGGRRESVGFAWLLGLYASIRRSPAGDAPRPLRVRLDKAEADELVLRMEELFGRSPSVREVDNQFDVFFGSKELSQYLHDITRGNAEIPWEHLVTVEERRAFLRSFLQRRCSLSAIGGVRPILAVGKRMSPSLRNGLLFLFAQFGIYPAFDDSRIFLQALPELDRVVSAELIASSERADRLVSLVKRAPYDSLDIEVDLYYRVLAGEESDLVPAETRRRWFLDELPPKIKRVERIAELLSESPDPDAIGYLFRGLKFSPGDARALARRSSLKQILAIVATLKEGKVPQESWSRWLGLSAEDIQQKLGGAEIPVLTIYGRRFRLTHKARMRYLQAYGLQPSEYEDFSICLEHIREELQAALNESDSPTRLESKALVFSLQGEDISSIRLVSHG